MATAAVCQVLLSLFHKPLTGHVVFRQRAGRGGRARQLKPVAQALTRAHLHQHERAAKSCLLSSREGLFSLHAQSGRERLVRPLPPSRSLELSGQGMNQLCFVFCSPLALESRRQPISYQEFKIQFNKIPRRFDKCVSHTVRARSRIGRSLAL